MISFEDKRWEGLKGGYKTVYDPRHALRQIETGGKVNAAWAELWEELHHQGDVGVASYAAVPHLIRIQHQRPDVDWNLYALISTIEIERHKRRNPPLPDWLIDSYLDSWKCILEIGTRDLLRTDEPLAVKSILGALALAKGQIKLGIFIVDSDESEIDEFLEERRGLPEV